MMKFYDWCSPFIPTFRSPNILQCPSIVPHCRDLSCTQPNKQVVINNSKWAMSQRSGFQSYDSP